jgi:predicted dehydrogenase/nucleoside-diphosphate-sugar epimerase
VTISNRQNEDKPRLRVGIVGCGNVAEHHASCVSGLKNAQMVGLADLNEEVAQVFARKHCIPTVKRSLSELLDAVDLDVLHVTTPPAHHYECAKLALDRGINVFVEKPLAFTQMEVDDLYERARSRGVLICPDYIQLFHPKMQKLLGELKSGKLGRVVHVESHWCLNLEDEIRDAEGLHWTYRLPGGFLRDYTSHVLYQALYFAGPPSKIKVNRKSLGALPQGLTDHLTIEIEGKHCTAAVLLSCLPRPSSYALRVYCDQGTAEIDFDTQTLLIARNSALPRRITTVTTNFVKSWRLSTQTVGNVWNYLSGALVPYAGLRVLIPQFYEAIEGQTMPPVSQELAVAVTRTEEVIFSDYKEPVARGLYVPSSQAGIHREKKVLVTGASGYVGTAVVKALVESGYYVRALTRPTSKTAALEQLGVEVFLGDIRRLEDVQSASSGMDVIVHAAAGMKGSAEAMVDTCVRGTQNVADAAAEQGVSRIIYIGSFSVYNFNDLKNGECITEDSSLEDKPETRGAYTLGKTRAEHLALAHMGDSAPAWTILRPSLLVGNGRDILAPVGSKLGNFLICMGSPGKKLLMLHVEDLATAVLRLLENENTARKVFVVSDPESPTVRQYTGACIRQSPYERLHVLYVPYLAARVGALAASVLTKLLGRGPKINKRRLLSVYRNADTDITPLIRETGWMPPAGLLARLKEGEPKTAAQPEEAIPVA